MIKLAYSFLLSLSLLYAEKPISDSVIQGRLNIVNGYSAECVMHKFYTNSGWTRIEGEVGRNGIDGLYYKKSNGIIKEVLVAESKWNKSKLGKSGKNKLIQQMSKQWILYKIQKLEKHKPLPEYPSINKLVGYDQYRARLFRMFPKGKDKIQIHVFEIKNKGSNNYDITILSKLDPITMGNPKNSFQKGVLDTYSGCRFEALRKYFPALRDKDVDLLANDNYLQKKDIKSITY